MYVSPAALVKRLGVGRSAGYDRIRRALMKGYLVDLATKDERRKKLVVGSALPDSDEFLPEPDAVFRWRPKDPDGQHFGPTVRPDGVMSGCPGRPAAPPDERAHEPFTDDDTQFVRCPVCDETKAIAVVRAGITVPGLRPSSAMSAETDHRERQRGASS